MTHLIEAKNLNTHYAASHILRDVNFFVARGETVGLMGRNGMGKSTLLKSIMGLVKPRSGTVDIIGKPMVGREPYEISQRGIAYVPEGRGIFGNLSVVENLKMAARAGTRGQRDWTYERVLETFPRLQERLGHGGQQIAAGVFPGFMARLQPLQGHHFQLTTHVSTAQCKHRRSDGKHAHQGQGVVADFQQTTAHIT